MIGSMAREFRAEPWSLAKRALGALGFLLFGAFALLDRESAFVTRLFGLLIAGSAGVFLGIYVREMIRPGTTVTLDREGVRVRGRVPETDLRVPWPGAVGARLVGEGHAQTVALDYLEDSAPPPADGRYPEVSTIQLPEIIGVPADEIAAEIERFRRAYAPAVANMYIAREEVEGA